MAKMKKITTRMKQELGSDVRRKFEGWRHFKIPFEGNHFLNTAFYYGFQWTIYNIATGELHEATNLAGNIRITSNQIQPRIRNLHAKMTKNKPTEDVLPEGWTAKHLYSAKVTKSLLDFYREIHNEETLDSHTIQWVLVAGDAFRKVGFDPDAGVEKQAGKMAEFAEMYQDLGIKEDPGELGFTRNQDQVSYHIGEVFDDLVTPFEMYVPEYATSLEDAQELMQVKVLPLHIVKEKWGKRAKEVTSSTNMFMANQFAQRLMGMANPDVGNSISRGLAMHKTDLCYVYELWKKPSKKNPRGKLIIAAGDTFAIVYNDENPYYDALKDIVPLRRFGCLPFAHFQGIYAPGRFWNISPIEPMRPMQVEYNKTISDVVQNRATVGRNKIIAPKTANIDEQEIANIHGQFLEYSGFKAPEIFPAVPLPVQIERETERNRQDMDTVSGSHEVSRAEAPSGVKSGIAINYLLEQDDTTIAPVIRDYERAKRLLAMMKIGIAKHFYNDQRIVDSTGDDALEVLTFSGQDLTTKIKIVPGSALPQSRAAMQATYLDLFERGAIVDERGVPDHKKLFELLRTVMPLESYSQEMQLDLSRSKRENILLAQGQEIVPKHFEDHMVHMSEHNKFRKTEEFYELHPQVQTGFDMHVRIHVDFLAPPTRVGSAEGDEGLNLSGASGNNGGNAGADPSRISPSFAGQGQMGSLNNPPSNKGGTIPGG